MKRQITAPRREILDLLRRLGPQTVDELSGQIGITPVAVRKHLDTLEIDGLVQSETVRRPIGRPAQCYSLTPAADELFPEGYEALVLSLLQQVERVGGEELLARVLNGRRDEIEAACREEAAGAATLDEWVDAIARVRARAGYMPEWTRADGTITFTELNCAICHVAALYPQLCIGTMELLERLLGDRADVEHHEHRLTGGWRCTYLIRERAAEGQ